MLGDCRAGGRPGSAGKTGARHPAVATVPAGLPRPASGSAPQLPPCARTRGPPNPRAWHSTHCVMKRVSGCGPGPATTWRRHASAIAAPSPVLVPLPSSSRMTRLLPVAADRMADVSLQGTQSRGAAAAKVQVGAERQRAAAWRPTHPSNALPTSTEWLRRDPAPRHRRGAAPGWVSPASRPGLEQGSLAFVLMLTTRKVSLPGA